MELREATEEQKRSRDRATHEAWGQRLTVEEYCRREIRLRAHRWPREAMRTWLLVEGGDVLASCETFAMPSRLDGRWGFSHGVASVFTEERLRGRGHAGEMIRRLPEKLQGAHAIVLFSEVGATLYERCGFTACETHDRLLPAAAGELEGEPIPETRLEEALASIPLPSDRFLVWPTAAQLDWHLERERIYAETLGRERPGPSGVRTEGGLLLWAADFKNERLAVLIGHARDEAVAARLLRSAQAVAARAGLAEVRIWEVPSLPLGSLGKRIPRDADALPMYLPLAPGVSGWLTIPRALWI